MKSILTRISHYINEQFFEQFGFNDHSDFFKSVFFSHIKASIILSTLFTSIHAFIDVISLEFFGLNTTMLIAFVFLIIAEYYSGIKVSMKLRQEKFEAKKSQRMILKIGTYLIILWISRVYSLENPIIFKGFAIKEIFHVLIFNMIFISLMLSWFENLEKLGYKIPAALLRYLNQLINKVSTK